MALRSVDMLYGTGRVRLDLPPSVEVLRGSEIPRAADPADAVRAALAAPIGCAPLREVAAQTAAAVQSAKLPREPMFSKLVSFVTRSVEGNASDADDAQHSEVVNALEAVKRARDARVSA